MKENICSIPINDIFNEKKGCPICTMYEMLQKNYVEHTTGPAMMAPNIRVITNKKGFCKKHFDMMVEHGPRLSNALILQTHLDEIRTTVLNNKGDKMPSKAQLQAIDEIQSSCYICDRIEHDIKHLLKTVFVEYSKSEEFRQTYKSQEFLCFEHYNLLMKCMLDKKAIDKKYRNEFIEDTNTLCKKQIDLLYDDITHFTKMYDYNNRGKDFGNSKDSIERSVDFLSKK